MNQDAVQAVQPAPAVLRSHPDSCSHTIACKFKPFVYTRVRLGALGAGGKVGSFLQRAAAAVQATAPLSRLSIF